MLSRSLLSLKPAVQRLAQPMAVRAMSTSPLGVDVWRKPENLNKTPEELIAEIPPIEVSGRVAKCDGGGGPLGHPVEYIKLDTPFPETCKYCGLRFIRK